jgi:hypothetical protein
LVYFNEEEVLRHSVTLHSLHRVCYKFATGCESLPTHPAVHAQVSAFRQRCEAVHEKLEEFVRKYRI